MKRDLRNLYLVVNPTAGAGKCMKKHEQAKRLLSEKSVAFKEMISLYKGHVPLLLQQALDEDAKCIVIIGGDGTVREAIPALLYKEICMFIFPFGRGNDFAKFLGISTNPEEAVDQLLSGHAKKIDAAKANESHYLNVAGFGFDVQVLVKTERFKKRFKNKTAYMLALFSVLIHLRSYNVTIETSLEKRQCNALVVSAGNGMYIGGGMAVLPRADICDGKLDICVMHDVKKRRLPFVLFQFLKGNHVGLPETDYFTTEKVTIHTRHPLPVQLDGEIIEETPVTFKVLPKAIRMILPPQGASTVIE